MLLAGAVAQAAGVHEGCRATAVEIERVGGAQREQRLGKLAECHPGVVARASVAGHRQRVLTRDGQGGARIAPVGDVGIELMGGGGETLAVLAVGVGSPALRNQQRPRLQQITGGVIFKLITPGDPRAARLGMDACPDSTPGGVEGHRRRGCAIHPDLPERHARRAQEESAYDGVANVVVAAQRTTVAGCSSTATRGLTIRRS